MEQIHYRDIEGYEGLYKVSAEGEVWSVERDITQPNGGVRKTGGKHMALQDDKDGYKVVMLYKDGAKDKLCKVHRLVANAYLPKVEGKTLVNHKNGIKTDNQVENLEWCSDQENHDHAYATGLYKNWDGENSHTAKLTSDQVVDIRLETGKRINEIAAKYGVSYSTIYKILAGHTWKHIHLPAKETVFYQNGPHGKMEAEEVQPSVIETNVMDEIKYAASQESPLTAIAAQHDAIMNGIRKAVEDEGDCPNDTCDGSGYYEDFDGKNVPCLHTVEARGDDKETDF